MTDAERRLLLLVAVAIQQEMKHAGMHTVENMFQALIQEVVQETQEPHRG